MGGRTVQLAMCLGVVLLGLYLGLVADGPSATFGWVVVGLGVLGLAAGIALPACRPPRR